MPIKILIIEDQKGLADMIALHLQEEGYHTELIYDSKLAIPTLMRFKPDIIVTALMFSGKVECALISQIRQFTTVPMLVISNNTVLNIRIKALDDGADDFLCKPFSLIELNARIKALLRRCGRNMLTESQTVTQKNKKVRVWVNDYRHCLLVDDQEIEVTQIEFSIIKEMSCNPGKVFTRSELMDRIKGGDGAYLDRTIDVHISSLRKKIERDPKNPQHIRTVWGRGYKYEM
ncbi:response regulator transcription factor [Paenibacillus polymyxa]|uniref:Response regulator transcription factor n=1 Tax=Paenibacillus polymyxa TaxID=1406 RepID=A0A8I1LQN7_PAEPO|nr:MULTISPECIES: response regulator transcription factor [Paenibacillus]KAF6573036.1 response regulator transcription factor [Paenibacillus sp. EKM206P]KAF6587501.1 response regulator transcription factor [Paenibacillus sp. EKM205P]MBM0633686.1 response regulator transcription factor [Paenibacillus polymyxa]MDY8095916.1 response regulator transcription factor [Paenibacillus polymyxa]